MDSAATSAFSKNKVLHQDLFIRRLVRLPTRSRPDAHTWRFKRGAEAVAGEELATKAFLIKPQAGPAAVEVTQLEH
jgi:hypothetical protein